ncbi:hypothetical protein B0I00_2790 [Novosphingobium kunmingense]|uniref:Uncharacterized protein n=1 Tax=Novosphingobium kunmingense TaxID=1211806 RepID=A0A2N0H5F4_9SPHN|nr:hypothetical protein [Novosphingobium kunmingense]PKB14159.1 hypothetical protein B0I00_2790 [Novosphingobium kunmingense]
MGLFKADLYRSFAIGFVLGAAALVAGTSAFADEPQGGIVAAAQAAPVVVDHTR